MKEHSNENKITNLLIKYSFVLIFLSSCNFYNSESKKIPEYVYKRIDRPILSSYYQSIEGVGEFTRIVVSNDEKYLIIRVYRTKSADLEELSEVYRSSLLESYFYKNEIGVEVRKVLGVDYFVSDIWSDETNMLK